MDFKQYQEAAAATRKSPQQEGADLFVSLLGLAGETGQLLSEYKKALRDGPSHELHKRRVSEELGDLLWYLSSVADLFDLSLDEVAQENVAKVKARWGSSKTARRPTTGAKPLDHRFPVPQRLPRQGTAEIRPVSGSRTPRIKTLINGKRMGEHLTDNAHVEDGYRLHDVFHLGCMTLLGWSPVVRRGLKAKRKKSKRIDEVEDGGRAIVIEEGVSALVFSYGVRHKMLDGIHELDYSLLRTIKEMTEHLEVRVRTEADWEQTILQSYEVWRSLLVYQGGRVAFDADAAVFTFIGPPKPPAKRKTARR